MTLNQNEMRQTAIEWLYDQIENKRKCIYEVFEQAKAMEKKQREKCFIEGYKNRALLSNLIFDEASKLFAKSLFEQNQTFKSE